MDTLEHGSGGPGPAKGADAYSELQPGQAPSGLSLRDMLRSPDPATRKRAAMLMADRSRRARAERAAKRAPAGASEPTAAASDAVAVPAAVDVPQALAPISPAPSAPQAGLDAVVDEPERLQVLRDSVEVLKRGLRATRLHPIMERGAVVRHEKVPDFAERKNAARELIERLAPKPKGAGGGPTIVLNISAPQWLQPAAPTIIDVTPRED